MILLDKYSQALIMSSQSQYFSAIVLHPTDILIDTTVRVYNISKNKSVIGEFSFQTVHAV
jgi:predicted transcriptional regulator